MNKTLLIGISVCATFLLGYRFWVAQDMSSSNIECMQDMQAMTDAVGKPNAREAEAKAAKSCSSVEQKANSIDKRIPNLR